MIAIAADDPFTPDLHCSVGDFGCYTQEGITRFIGSLCKALGSFIADMLTNAFTGAQATGADWDIAGGHFWFWTAVATMIALAIGLWQIAVASVMQQPGRILTIFAGMIAGVFASVMALRMMPTVVAAFSGLTANVTAGLSGSGGVGEAIMNVIGLGGGANGVATQLDPNGAIVLLATASPGLGTNAAAVPLILALFALGAIALAALLLFLAMSVRTFALIALVAFAPMGLMFLGQPRMKDLAEKWFQLCLGLLLAEPLAAGILMLATNIASRTTASSMGLLLVSAAAIFVAAFSPLWAVKFVSFAGGEVHTAMSNVQFGQSSTSRGAGGAVRWVGRSLGRFGRA